jgi:hypothetical protein
MRDPTILKGFEGVVCCFSWISVDSRYVNAINARLSAAVRRLILLNMFIQWDFQPAGSGVRSKGVYENRIIMEPTVRCAQSESFLFVLKHWVVGAAN